MISTIGLTKTAITRGGIRPGDIIDNTPVARVQHSNKRGTRIMFAGEGWGEWVSSDWHISVYR